jgi:hypothetical protein
VLDEVGQKFDDAKAQIEDDNLTPDDAGGDTGRKTDPQVAIEAGRPEYPLRQFSDAAWRRSITLCRSTTDYAP